MRAKLAIIAAVSTIAVVGALVVAALAFRQSEPDGPSAAPRPAPASAGDPRANADLLAAARAGQAEAVRDALARGAAVDHAGEQGRTALWLAVSEDHLDAARVLLAAGANQNIADDGKESPFLVVSVTGSTQMMLALLDAPTKPDVTIKDRYNGTALIRAADKGNADYIRILLDRTDVAVDHVNKLGWTAMLEAVILGDGSARYQETVRLIRNAGADISIEDRSGTTALQHAERKGQTAVAEILRNPPS